MTDLDIEIQAEHLNSYLSRGGDPDRWWYWMDFSPRDRERIEAVRDGR